MAGERQGYGAMSVRSPLIRHRPWLSDRTWIAHESLTVFVRLAGLMPRNGWWVLGEGGATHRDDVEAPDLEAKVVELVGRSEPCVINFDEYQRTADSRAAMHAAIEISQRAEVIDQQGDVWIFNQDHIEVATLQQDPWTWRLAPERDGAALIGIDRKGRPRFVLMSLHQAPSESEAA